MASPDLGKFLKALDAVKEDYTCGACGELCKNPVTLSACFHLICEEHFESLKVCPTCSIPLDGCKTFKDDRLQACISSTKELDKIFQGFRSTANVLQSSKPESEGRKRVKRVKPVHNVDEGVSEKEDKEMASKSNRHKRDRKENLDTTIASSVSSKVKMEKRNNKGETALHIACRLGKIDRVTELLNQGVSTNTKDHAGWTPLHEVVQNGRFDLVNLLLQFNTLINVPGPGNETPLHEAVRFGHKDIAEELVRHGADINSKNCKGETPLELATGDMKNVLEDAADNIIQTQGVNVTMISELHTELDFEDIKVFCSSDNRSVHNKLKSLTKSHSNLNVEVKFTKKATHLVVDTEDDFVCTSSLDVLQGIVNGIWILSSQWVMKSSDEKLEPFRDYEVKGVGSKTYNGPKNSRYNKYKQLPGIFNGCHFYLHNFNAKFEVSKTVVLTKAILTKLITDAGGIVLKRVPNPESIPDAEKLVPYHAKKGGKLTICSHYIIFKDIYEPMYNMQHFKALPIGWLIECIEKYKLCEPW